VREPLVLVLTDDAFVGEAMVRALTRGGFRCRRRSHAEQPTDADSEVDVAVVDLDGDGRELLPRLRRAVAQLPEALVVALAEPNGSAMVVAAVRAGASDFVAKPVDFGSLSSSIRDLLRSERGSPFLAARVAAELEGPGKPSRPVASEASVALVSTSEEMRGVLDLADRVARSPRSSALILGESGVGKEKIAERIHAASARARRPFVRVNLAAFTESMVEAELFGSVRGAFTGAARDRAGLIASADGGTLLLDELCEFRIDLQAKLLRVLEERRFYPVGSDRERAVDVRILAATNREPRSAIADGSLREDLYYRLATVTLAVPPLRERRDDILPLVDHFSRWYAAELGRPAAVPSHEAERALVAHRWPGNVRELRNAVERAHLLHDDEVLEPAAFGLTELPDAADSCMDGSSEPTSELRLQTSVREVERQQMQRALQLAAGDVTRAAATLGVSRSTFYEKRRRYGL
jgi:DNA-binding NtrC family response regulator